MTPNDLALTEKKRNFILLGIFILSLTVKVTVFYFATDPVIFNKYPYFAEQLSKGAPIGERILDLSPAYLYITVLFYKLFGSNWEALALLQILMGSLNCLFIYLIGARVFGKAAGLAAATMLMLYGNMTLIELTLEPETFVLIFNTLSILALMEAGNRHTPYRSWKWLLSGMLIGMSIITKPNALLIIPGALIWSVLVIKTWRRRYQAMASMLIGVVILVAPITIRNHILFDDFVLVTADGGKVFFHGNGPGATGMERADLPDQGFIEEGSSEPDYAHVLFRKVARQASKATLKPSECADYWFERTIDHIHARPRAALFLELKKFGLFWNNYEVHDLDSTYKNYTLIRKWPLIPIGVIAALGILGMGVSLKRFRDAFLIYWMIFIYLFSVLVFFAASRYRIPAAPFLCLFASGFIIRLYEVLFKKNLINTAICLVLIPILLAWTYLPFQSEITQFDQWQQASRIHYSLGGRALFAKAQYREAITEFKKVLSADPDFTPACNYLGKSYAILGEFDKAQHYFQRVIDLAPTLDEGYLNMGLLFQLKGEPSSALPYFNKALSLNADNAKAKEHIGMMKSISP